MKRASAFLMFLAASAAWSAGALPDTFASYRLINLDRGELYVSPDLGVTPARVEDKWGSHRVQTFRIGNDRYALQFDEGPSDDPHFLIYHFDETKWERVGAASGSRIFVNSAGHVYSGTESNNLFEEKRKYVLEDGKQREVEQPLLLVNLACRTSNALAMRAGEAAGSEIVARLPAGQPVSVIAAKFYGRDAPTQPTAFLVATPFGLTGWVDVEAGYLDRPGDPIDCIRSHGD